ncbi:MAG: DNA-binding protein [Desulfobacca sp.]|nr:DNA-binding protein [Desulfobacca sp.]
MTMTIMKAKEIGEYLKLTPSTIYNLASDGVLPGFKIGRSWRFDREEIFKIINRQKEQYKNGKKED